MTTKIPSVGNCLTIKIKLTHDSKTAITPNNHWSGYKKHTVHFIKNKLQLSNEVTEKELNFVEATGNIELINTV